MKWLETLLTRMGLEINREKTRIARIADGFDFLGLTFKEARGRGTGRRFALSYPHRKAMQAIRQKIKETVREHPYSTPARDVVVNLNRVLKGWGAFFEGSNASRQFTAIDYYALDQVRMFLRRKHNRTDNQGYRAWPASFLQKRLGLHRLSGRMARRRIG
jgi:RNA-directed DNA polymerase